MANIEFNCKYCKQKTVKKERKDREQLFCSHKCYSLAKPKDFIIKNGYKLVAKSGHPRTDARGYVREHLLIMEEKIGRPVKRSESVHHIDGDKLNNHPDNLHLFRNHKEHLLHEWKNNTLRSVNCGARANTFGG